jgi:hypothetical protein
MTPRGRNPFPAMFSSATCLSNPALVRISQDSSHVWVRRHSPTRGEATAAAAAAVVGAAEAVPLLSSAPPQAAASRARLATRISGPNRRRVGMRHPPSVRRHHQRDGRRLILSRPITRANAACRPRATSSGHQQTSLDFGSAPACLRSTSSSPVRVRPVHGGSRRSHGGGTARGSGTGFRKARE